MKVLTFLTRIDISRGGPSRSVPMFVRGLALQGVDITLMAMETENMNLHALDGTDAKVHLIPVKYKKADIENFIASEEFDVIHGQCIWAPLFHDVRVIADKYKIPFILTPRGTLEPWSMQQKKWKKKIAMWLYQRYDLNRCACIYTTADMEAQHIKELGFNRPMCVIPNGIETEGYPCRTSNEDVKKQVLFLSRVHPKKGIEVLIDAWTVIHKEFPNWILTIVGNGEEAYIQSLKAKVKELGLEGYVQISAPVFGKDKIKLYQSSSLFCLPSYSENFGMVIAEALSCGVPVLTTDNTPWEILNETNTGWCIPLSTEGMIEKLRLAMSMDASELYEMGQRGSQMVYDNFNYHSCALKNKALYEWVVNGGQEPEFMYKG